MRTAKACCRLESEVRWRGEAIEGSDIWRAANGECRLAIGGWRMAMASDEWRHWRRANGEWRVETNDGDALLVSTLLERKGDSGYCLKPMLSAPLRWGGLGHLPYLVVA